MNRFYRVVIAFLLTGTLTGCATVPGSQSGTKNQINIAKIYFDDLGYLEDLNKIATASIDFSEDVTVLTSVNAQLAAIRYDLDHKGLLTDVWKNTLDDAGFDDNVDLTKKKSREVMRQLQPNFFKAGLVANLDIVDESSPTFLPMTKNVTYANRKTLLAIETIHGSVGAAEDYPLREVLDKRAVNFDWNGRTIGTIAVLNEAKISARNRNPNDRVTRLNRKRIAAHELAHVEFYRRYEAGQKEVLPLESLTTIGNSPFRLTTKHVQEFLATAVSIEATRPSGYVFETFGLFSDKVIDNGEGVAIGNVNSHYGFVTEFLFQSLRKAELASGYSADDLQADALRRAAISRNTKHRREFSTFLGNKRIRRRVQDDFRDMAQKFIEAIDKANS